DLALCSSMVPETLDCDVEIVGRKVRLRVRPWAEVEARYSFGFGVINNFETDLPLFGLADADSLAAQFPWQ
ncbi:MAG: hypothetical protein AAFN13_04550, partial [Bacteroidota bacterium]